MNRTFVLLGALAAFGIGTAQAEVAPANCQSVKQEDVIALFERWNDTLKTGDAHKVAALYADDAILLPTVSKTPRLTTDEKVDYFEHFLKDRPIGTLDTSHVQLTCNNALHTGLYTFRFAATNAEVKARYTFTYRWNGEQWLISSHHSSLLPST
ncbi:Calcium/calmodulin dependent protein kinase II Association [compost metagenome]